MFMCTSIPNRMHNSLRVYSHAYRNKNYFEILPKMQHFKMMAEENIDQHSFSYLKPATSPAGIIFLDLLNLTPIMVARKKAVTEQQTNHEPEFQTCYQCLLVKERDLISAF